MNAKKSPKLKSVDLSHGEFDSLKATPAAWAAAKHYCPMGEDLQRCFVVGWTLNAFAVGMGFRQREAAIAGAEAKYTFEISEMEKALGPFWEVK